MARLNALGVFDAADVHVASTLARVTEEEDEAAVLAAAWATRAVRQGSVAVDLSDVLTQLEDLPSPGSGAGDAVRPEAFPGATDWLDRVRRSRLVDQGALVVEHDLVYLQRYHEQEVAIVRDLRDRCAQPPPVVDERVLSHGLTRVFPDAGYEEQRAAARIVLHAWTSVLTGGPGTGKTTTVAGVLALLAEQAAVRGDRHLRVGLAAPTGKAAARMQEAVAEALDGILERTTDPAARAVIARLADVPALTLHRLLGRRPDSSTRFRHDRSHRLPHDVVLVDESSMISLTHMARLLEALRPSTRLILVGDADQLVSVDAGAVLADLVAGVQGTGVQGTGVQTRAADPARETAAAPGPPVAVARLRTAHRFGRTIGDLAEHLRLGDADAVIAHLTACAQERDGAVMWLPEPDAPTHLRGLLTRHALRIRTAALAGDADTALGLLDEHRLLCAHREGPHGVRSWNARVEGWLAEETGDPLFDPMYVGRPLLVTRNDYATGVFNGDTGVVIAEATPAAETWATGSGAESRTSAPSARAGRAVPTARVRHVAVIRGSRPAHPGRRDGPPAWPGASSGAGPLGSRHGGPSSDRDQRFGPSRLGDIETMHAMTIHKAQGSQSRDMTVLLPDEDSRLLTRELLYTAVTRAQERVRLVGSEASIRAAVGRRVVRASGLRQRLAPLASGPRRG